MPFLKVWARSETQITSPRIWTRVTGSISYYKKNITLNTPPHDDDDDDVTIITNIKLSLLTVITFTVMLIIQKNSPTSDLMNEDEYTVWQKPELMTTRRCGVVTKNGERFFSFSPMTDDYVFTCVLFIVSAFVFFADVLVCTYVMLRQAQINENECYKPGGRTTEHLSSHINAMLALLQVYKAMRYRAGCKLVCAYVHWVITKSVVGIRQAKGKGAKGMRSFWLGQKVIQRLLTQLDPVPEPVILRDMVLFYSVRFNLRRHRYEQEENKQ